MIFPYFTKFFIELAFNEAQLYLAIDKATYYKTENEIPLH